MLNFIVPKNGSNTECYDIIVMEQEEENGKIIIKKEFVIQGVQEESALNFKKEWKEFLKSNQNRISA